MNVRIGIALEYIYRIFFLAAFQPALCASSYMFIAKKTPDGGEREGDYEEERRQAVACRRTIITNSCVISGNHLI